MYGKQVKTKQVALACAVCMAMAFSARAAETKLILVEEGRSRAPIVVYRDAPRFTRQAADELAHYIAKTSGAKPEVIEGEPDPVPPRAIWVGYQAVLDELFPDQDFDFQHPEEILIAANENHLVIAGRDRFDPNHLVIEGRRGKPLEGVQQEYGTVNAVYTFLQDRLGVRWLWPGELGEDTLDQPTIAFEPFSDRYHPRIRARGGLMTFSSLRGGGYGISREWTRKQRLQLDSLTLGGGHAFSDWWERFSETHREYFALQPDGTRSGFPSPRTVKLCQSNPAVWQQWLADVEAQLEKNPNQRVFNAAPNDGWSSGHCVCENCRAWDHPEGEQRRFGWQGVSQMYVALSDRHVTFANHCSELLKQRYPDKTYYVLMLAYGHSRPPPVAAVPADNVIISSVTGFWGFDGPEGGSPQGTTHGEQITGWAKVANHLAWRPNSGSPAGWRHGLPDVPLDRMIDNFNYLVERDIMGIYIDSVWEHWGTQGPLYYLMAQLTWDPSRNGHEILEDYYRRGFGPGAEAVKAYWRLMETTRNTFVDTYNSWSINRHYREVPNVYTDELFDRAAALLDRAAAQVADGDVHRRRVALVRAGLDYTRLAVKGRALIERFEQSDGTDLEAKRKAIETWEAVDQLRQEHPLAVNWGCLGGQRSPLTASFLPSISPRWR